MKCGMKDVSLYFLLCFVTILIVCPITSCNIHKIINKKSPPEGEEEYKTYRFIIYLRSICAVVL